LELQEIDCLVHQHQHKLEGYLEIISSPEIKTLELRIVYLGVPRTQVQFLAPQILKLMRAQLHSVLNYKILNHHQYLEIPINRIQEGLHQQTVYLEMILYNQCLVLQIFNNRQLKLGLPLE